MTKLNDIPALTWSKIQLALVGGQVTESVLNAVAFHAPAPMQIGVTAIAVSSQVGCSVMRVRRKTADAATAAATRAKEERERKWHEDARRIAVPDPRPEQCPVCGLDDLPELALRDGFLQMIGAPGSRVVSYGPLTAHRECAEIVPYEKRYRDTTEDRHHRGHHHGIHHKQCAACQREQDSGVNDPYRAPLGCTCAQCKPDVNSLGRIVDITGYDDYRHTPRLRSVYACTWTCNWSDGDGVADSYTNAKKDLINHAKTDCIAIKKTLGPKPVKNALASVKDPLAELISGRWLTDAAQSHDAGVRAAAQAVLDRMRGVQ